jgi:hypothetical protein
MPTRALIRTVLIPRPTELRIFAYTEPIGCVSINISFSLPFMHLGSLQGHGDARCGAFSCGRNSRTFSDTCRMRFIRHAIIFVSGISASGHACARLIRGKAVHGLRACDRGFDRLVSVFGSS